MSDASVDGVGGGNQQQNLVPDNEDDSVGNAYRRRDADESSNENDGPKSSLSSIGHQGSDLSHSSSDNDQDERAAAYFGLHPGKAREWRRGQNGPPVYDDAGPLEEGKMRAVDNNGFTIHVSEKKTGDKDEYNFEERLEAKVNTTLRLLTDIQSLMMNQLNVLFGARTDLTETKDQVKKMKDQIIELCETVEDGIAPPPPRFDETCR